MKSYVVVRGGNIEDLQEKVEELLVEGYRPTGGVSILANCYVQVVYHARALNAIPHPDPDPIVTYTPHPKKDG